VRLGALVTAVAATLTLGGCLLGPNYTRPPVPVPDGWRTATAPVQRADPGALADAGTLADLGWWEFFGDPALRDLIRVAVEENKDVQIAVARVEQARAQLAGTAAERWPRLDNNASYATLRDSEVSFPPTVVPANTPGIFRNKAEGAILRTTLDVAFELDVWGRLRRATEAARAELLASDETRRSVLLTLVSDVATTYFNILGLDEELAVSQRAVDARRETVRILRARAREGIASELEVRRVEGELAATTAVIPDLERQMTQTEHRLSVLVGRNPGPIARGSALAAHPVPVSVPAGLPSALLDRRPDVRQAEQQLVAANARIGEAKAAFFPQIRLTGLYGVESASLSDLFTGPARVWRLGPSISVPLFDAGRNRARVDLTQARREEALIQYQQVVQTAFREVEDALIAHRKNREVLAEQEAQVTANRESVRLARLRYFNGVGSQIDVLDAERQLLTAEIAATRTRLDQLVTLVQIYKALGGGWK
jgi:multidrug efflux system outer membrane protein